MAKQNGVSTEQGEQSCAGKQVGWSNGLCVVVENLQVCFHCQQKQDLNPPASGINFMLNILSLNRKQSKTETYRSILC